MVTKVKFMHYTLALLFSKLLSETILPHLFDYLAPGIPKLWVSENEAELTQNWVSFSLKARLNGVTRCLLILKD